MSSKDAAIREQQKEASKLRETNPLIIATLVQKGFDCADFTECILCPFCKSDGACELEWLTMDSYKAKQIIQAKIDELSKPKGVKYDQDKPEVYYMFREFRHALLEVAKVATEGGKKYGKSNWRLIEQERWQNSMCHYILADNDINEGGFGLLHKAHVAFGALADLEKELTK